MKRMLDFKERPMLGHVSMQNFAHRNPPPHPPPPVPTNPLSSAMHLVLTAVLSCHS